MRYVGCGHMEWLVFDLLFECWAFIVLLVY